jgi:hypothetical protein
MKELKQELNNIDIIYGKVNFGIKKVEKFASQLRRRK